MLSDRLITVAIHTYDRAHRLKAILESEGITVSLQNVNLTNPSISAGVRVRIPECDLPQALRIIENIEILVPSATYDSHQQVQGSILVPVDFSDNSMKATIVAFRLAASLNVGIHLLHTYIDPAFSGQSVMQLSDSLSFDQDLQPIDDMEIDKSLASIARDSMKKFEEKIRDKIKAGVISGVKFTSEIAEGLPEEIIDDYVSSHKNILTVMGTHGANSNNREILGSVTAEVLDSCRTMVLTVPFNTPWASKGMPAHAVYFSTASQEDIIALDTLYHLFPDVALKITLVALPTSRFSKPNPDALEPLLKYCRTNYPAFSFNASPLSITNPVEEFSEMSCTSAVDMIVIPNRRKNIFSRLFNPSLAHKLLFHSDIPLMSIPVKG